MISYTPQLLNQRVRKKKVGPLISKETIQEQNILDQDLQVNAFICDREHSLFNDSKTLSPARL